VGGKEVGSRHPKKMTQKNDSQDALELTSGAGQQEKICAGEIAVECLVGGTPSNERLVYRRMLCVPVKPVLSICNTEMKTQINKLTFDVREMVVGQSLGGRRGKEVIHHGGQMSCICE